MDENEKNLEYLIKDLKYLGLGEGHETELKTRIGEKPDKFGLLQTLEFKRPDGMMDKVSFKAEFNRSEKSDRYFLNSHTATLKNDADPTKEKSQIFYISTGSGITAKEAYNMLNGRPVHKELTTREGENYKAWVQLDFTGKEPNGNFKVKQFHQNYGFDLPEVLSKYPIKELNDHNLKIELLRGLERGNVRPATFLKEGGVEEKVLLVANPQFKNILVFDSAMKPMKTQGAERKEQQPDKKKQEKESIKPSSDDEESQKRQKKQKPKRMKV